MTTPRPELEAEAKAAILRAMRIYAPDEVETYGNDEAEMIAEYVVPLIEAAHARGRAEGLDQAQDAAESFITFKQPGDSVDTRTIHTNATASAIAAAIRALGGPR